MDFYKSFFALIAVFINKGGNMKKWAVFIALSLLVQLFTSDWSGFERGVAAGFLAAFFAIYELHKQLESTNEMLIKALGSRYD